MNQSIITCIFFSIAGYLSGSILYAYWIPKILFQKDICALSPDGNPGTANAFVYGGFRAGILALLLELFKGFFPVVLALRTWNLSGCSSGSFPCCYLYSFFCGLNYPATSFPVHYYLWRILPSGLSLCAGSLH